MRVETGLFGLTAGRTTPANWYRFGSVALYAIVPGRNKPVDVSAKRRLTGALQGIVLRLLEPFKLDGTSSIQWHIKNIAAMDTGAKRPQYVFRCLNIGDYL